MGAPRIHRKNWDRDWDVHHLVFSTFQRQKFFPGEHAAHWFLDALAKARKECPFHLFAYVIMPEHIHLVLQPLPGVLIQTVRWHLKRPVTASVLAWVKQFQPSVLNCMADIQPSGRVSYRFWQRGGGYNRNLRTAQDVSEKIGYIHANPVRRGLVLRPEDWPYSSAKDWVLGQKGAVPIDWEYLPELS